MEYEAIIGLEIHVECRHAPKYFADAATAFGAEPNTNCCPGLPGTARDPAGAEPPRRGICCPSGPGIELPGAGEKCFWPGKTIFIPTCQKPTRFRRTSNRWPGEATLKSIFPKEAAGSTWSGFTSKKRPASSFMRGDSIISAAYSLVDYNRAGVPLLEIVTAPELYSGREARLFLQELRTLLRYIGVSDVKMEEGSLRCDANISLRPVGTKELGTRAEVKNLNSFRAVEQALNYEAERQAMILGPRGRDYPVYLPLG